jgi:hypothetical protein
MTVRWNLWITLFLGIAFSTACQETTAPEQRISQEPLEVASGPVQNPANGHWYEFVESEGITWSDARVAAETKIFLGADGHLATIHSEQENDFVADLIAFRGWLGGFQPPGSPEPGGGWQWVTGEPFVYDNWRPGEPNNLCNDAEDYIEMFGAPNVAIGLWNDATNAPLLGCTAPAGGFVVEYEPEDNPTSKDQCKKEGWRAFGFRNQGQCIRFVNTGKDSRIGD